MYKHQFYLFNLCVYSNQTEAVTTLLEAGANVNTVLNGMSLLDGAVRFGNCRIIRAIATTAGIMLDAQVTVD